MREDLRRLLARNCRDAHEVEDLIQETFLRAARYRGSHERLGSLRSWVLRIAANVRNDRRGRGARSRSVSNDDARLQSIIGREPDPAELEEERHLRVGERAVPTSFLTEELRTAIRGLAVHDRDVLHSYYEQGRNCRETGAKCDLSASLVKVRLFRARRRLERVLLERIAEGEW